MYGKGWQFYVLKSWNSIAQDTKKGRSTGDVMTNLGLGHGFLKWETLTENQQFALSQVDHHG